MTGGMIEDGATAGLAGSTELVILGGPKAFAERLHVGRPNIGDRSTLIQRMAGILDRRCLTNDGPLVREFEQAVAEFVDQSAALSGEELQRVLWAENVLARRYFFPGCHRMEPYRSAFAEAGRELPEAERLTDRLLALPTGTAVGPATVAVVSDLIRRAMADGRRRGDDCRRRRCWTAILRHEVGARAS